MKKLKLDLDALSVDTFDPTPPEGEQGTVLGEQIAVTLVSCNAPCISLVGTCYASCLATCITCNLSCYRTCGVTCQFTCQYTCFTCRPTCGPNTCITCPTGCGATVCGPLCNTLVCP
jgi:hypothetical protein